MWTSGQFRDFLMTQVRQRSHHPVELSSKKRKILNNQSAEQGAGDFWDKMIYPGMREAIIGTYVMIVVKKKTSIRFGDIHIVVHTM